MYLLIFNLICTWGKLSVVDEQQVRMTKVSQVVENQLKIIDKLGELVKDETNIDFAKLKLKYQKEWRTNRTKTLKDTGLRIAAVVNNKDPDEYIKQIQDNRQRL